MSDNDLPMEISQDILDLAKQYPELMGMNKEAMAGLFAGMPPSIGMKSTRFKINADGEDTILECLTLPVVILRGKEALSKQWWATKFAPGQEPKQPDCMSVDGLFPVAGCPAQQHPQCAGCPQNEYGSGVDQNGLPTKGKACKDMKVLAVYAPIPMPDGSVKAGIYQLNVPPASLGNFGRYVSQLTKRNVVMQAALTKIGFDPSVDYPSFTFAYHGALNPKQFKGILEKIGSEEVNTIINPSFGGQKQLPPQTGQTGPSAAELADKAAADERVAEAKADAAAKAAAAAKQAAETESATAAAAAAAEVEKKKRTRRTKEEMEAARAAEAAAASKTTKTADPLGDLAGLGGEEEPPPPEETGGPSEDEFLAALGL